MIKEIIKDLEEEKNLVEKTMFKVKSPLRYLELKAIYECLKRTINKIEEIDDRNSIPLGTRF